MSNWEERFEKLLFTDEETEQLKNLVDSILDRTQPENPLEFGYLSEQFARLAGYEIATAEQKAKEEYAKQIADDLEEKEA